MSFVADTSAAILAENGLLSEVIAGFKSRDAQIEMATAIENALVLNSKVVIEAGTGIGKTFAYLIPVLLAGKKAIISTGTKNLQDQLFFNDLPVVKKIIQRVKGTTPKIVLLKGRANYLCKHRLESHREDGRFTSRQQIIELETVAQWATATTAGDIAELDAIAEDSSVWPYATSNSDNCLNQECTFYNDCFVVKARQQAQAADVVVVNHHLFFADMALQETGFGELLPNSEAVIFDEAHHLPDIAAHFFSKSLSSRQLNELARDSEVEALKSAKDMQVISDKAIQLQRASLGMRTALGNDLKAQPWPEKYSATLENVIHEIKCVLQELESALKEAAMRSKGLENCWKRSIELIEKFTLMTQQTITDQVHWFEMHMQSFVIHLTPVVVAEHFKYFLQDRKKTWVFTSATLTVNDDFNLFVDTLGLHDATLMQLKSPYDYQKQALLYVPRGLPDPNSKDYVTEVVEAAIPILEMSGGRSFLLFTSHRALETAAFLLQDRVAFPILRQGTKSKRQLIDEFKELGNAVLLGTSSFWYGVDVRGDALSCVIIDKLPFSSPDDPVLQAKVRLMRKQGQDPFSSYQLPNAVLTLKQGVGRLIRGEEDHGVLVICDPRLVASRYGNIFLRSLPCMSRTRELSTVAEFFKHSVKPQHETISA